MANNTQSPFSGRIPFFLQEVLSTPAGAIPKNAQWVLSFEGVYNEPGKDLLPVQAIKKGVLFEPQRWNINDSIDLTVDRRFQLDKTCMFIQALKIPGESSTANIQGIQTNGFLRSYTGGGRDSYSAMEMSFLDTNISFVDNTIRAWVIAVSHLGMIARKGPENYRCNFSVFKLGVTSRNEPPTILQKYTFFGACPISITTEEWNYSLGTSFVPRDAAFIYHYYTLDSVTDNRIFSEDKKHRAERKNLSNETTKSTKTTKTSYFALPPGMNGPQIPIPKTPSQTKLNQAFIDRLDANPVPVIPPVDRTTPVTPKLSPSNTTFFALPPGIKGPQIPIPKTSSQTKLNQAFIDRLDTNSTS